MSLQFVIGNSGYGKSTYLYDQVIRQSVASPNKNYLFIVPEQFTMQTQKEFVRRHPRHGILNIDVLSFQRLAYRVFDEVGGFCVPVLDETGKMLVLKKVAENCKKQLKVLGSSMKKPGTLDELKSILSEFTQYQVTSRQLEELSRNTKSKGLQYKLQDLQILYDGFFQYLEDHFITGEQVLQALCQVIDRSRLVRGSVIVLDGFTGFTPLQNALLHRMMRLSERMLVAVTIDRRAAGRGRLPEHELFALSAKTMDTLRRIAGEERVEIEPVVCLDDPQKSRLFAAPALRYMEQNLFRGVGGSHYAEPADGEIRIVEASNPVRELTFAAREIRRLVREEGYRYSQIAVVSGGMAQYADYLERIFTQYEIPFFLDNTAPLLMNPMIDMIRALLHIVPERFSYESVFRYFRCGLSGTERSDVDRLENYVLARGIRGLSMWQETWVRKTEGMAPEDLERLNGLRQQFVDDIQPFAEVCGKKASTVREKTEALYAFLVKKDLQGQLEKQRQKFEEQGQLAREKEYGQIYEIVMDLLDQYVTLLGDEQISMGEYTEILEAGLSAPKVGMLPPGTDYVTAGDIERTRLTDISLLFFVGVNDGIVPKAEAGGGILSELEREDLRSEDLELAPNRRENFFIQKFYLYLLMTKASKRLYLSYSSGGMAGETLRDVPDAAKLETKGEMLDWLRTEFGRENRSGLARALFQEMLGEKELRSALLQMEKARGFSGRDESIGRPLAQALYGGLKRVSVTRLENYAGCPYAHFLRYGLELKERELYQFTPVDNGNIFHEALERYADTLSLEGLSMADQLGERQMALADACIEESLRNAGGERLLSSARGQYHVRRMKRLMRRTVWALGVQLRRGRFQTADFELDFSGEGGIYPVPLFEGKQIMQLGGRIDRMDILDEEDRRYLRIIDYKTGKQEFSLLKFYHGLQLQLVVYLQAAMRLEKQRHPEKQMIPAGMFYYRLEDPLLKGREFPEEERQEQLLKKLRLDGYVNGDMGIVEKMDATIEGTSSVIPVTYKKDGGFAKSKTKAVTDSQMKMMMAHSDRILRRLGEEILSGGTAAAPYRLDQENQCGFCRFHSVCGFDRKLSCYTYRRLPKLDKETIWERMEAAQWSDNGPKTSGR